MERGFRTQALALSVLGVGLAAMDARAQEGGTTQLQEVVVEATPVPSSSKNAGVQVNKVPALVSRVVPHDFEVQHSPSVTDAITAHVPGAVAINVDGSDLSPDLFYRGFDISRISGTSQGLAVYQNGVRINEAFGDSVNLDLVPPIAVDHADVYTNNPIFGLNALGGAINFTMKNGFTFHGGDATLLGGSYGRVNGYAEYGKEVGNYSFYAAVDGYRDGGYRPFGAQNAERVYADLGYRSQDSEIHAIGQFGRSFLGVQGVTPQVLVNQQYNSVFTTPQSTQNQAVLGQVTGSFNVAPHWTVNSNFYIRRFDQQHIDGNDASVVDCNDADPVAGVAGTLCLDPNNAPTGATAAQLTFITPGGGTIASMGPGVAYPYGTTAITNTHTTTIGTQQQAINRDTIYGHDNYFVVGGSIDHSMTDFSSQTLIGTLNSSFVNQFVGFPGAGTSLQTAGQLGYGPTGVTSTATYYGVFALDTFNVTKQLAVTAGARFNLAQIDIQDVTGVNPELNSSSTYQRINPVVGATYEFSPALVVYGGYSEANRAPTPLETSCANPARPCILETALVSDPPLQQPVSHTVEAGGRGVSALPEALGGSVAYKAGFFRTSVSDDIISEPSAISGQGYYANVGETLRQGVEAGLMYNRGPLTFYANYAYIDATYQFDATLSSPNNPFADANGNIFVHPGNHIPGIPSNLGKIGFEYQVTPRFIVGMDAVIVGSQYFVGDDANQNPQLPAYYFLNAHASYQLTDHVQFFGLVKNLTNNRYATYGTFYDTGTDAGLVNATLAANAGGLADAVTVAQPLSFYGGVKVSF